MDKNDLKMPTEQELSEVVYDFCKKNKITYIREDELVRKILDEEMNTKFKTLQENYNLNENGYGKDDESSDAVTTSLVMYMMFGYKLTKRLFDIIDILIDECKVERKKIEGERLYYLRFYLYPLEIESIKLAKSTTDIFANDLYNYCKTNNIEYLKKDDVNNIIDFNFDDDMIDKIIDVLVKKNMARTFLLEDTDTCCIVFALTETKIKLNENATLMIKNLAELILDHCNANEIEYIEKVELLDMFGLEDDRIFEQVLDYLVKRHLADEKENPEDGKSYIQFYC